jgi:hypothetical protein
MGTGWILEYMLCVNGINGSLVVCDVCVRCVWLSIRLNGCRFFKPGVGSEFVFRRALDRVAELSGTRYK